MKLNYHLISKFILSISIALSLGFIIFVYHFASTSPSLVFKFTVSFLLIFWILLYIYQKCYVRESQNLYITVSDMLEDIMNNSYSQPFSENQDHLLSKIQSQVLKLRTSYLLHTQKAYDKQQEIQSLISDISHQLKTPLTNVKIYGDFLKNEELSKEEREQFSQNLFHQLEKLSFLTESLIKMSRLESGVIQLHPSYNSLNETVMKSVYQVYQKAMHKNIVIELNQNESISLNHDPNWISEGIFNILDNAIKYTPSGGNIKLNIVSYEMFARVDIKDNGIGISQEELNKIFQRFYRGKTADQSDGVGLGLYLARKIITMHGGYIKVKSDFSGSTFSIFLPL